ncbi:MAG: DNA repair protein RecO [Christensenellales bacterium]
MQTAKVMGIVARASDYRESDRVLTLLTAEHGKLTVTARGCRRPKSELLAGTQLFCYGEHILREINGIQVVSQCNLLESFYDLRTDYDRLDAAATALRCCEEVMQKGQPARELFALIYHTLAFLSYGTAPPVDTLICFLIKFLHLAGYGPSTTLCANCGASTFRTGRFNRDCGAVCGDCAKKLGGSDVLPLTLEAMRRMGRIELSDMGKVLLPAEVRRECVELLGPYYDGHLASRVKMAQTLHRLFSSCNQDAKAPESNA